MIDAERWSTLRELFHTAIDCDAAARGAILDRLRADDFELYGELAALLDESEQLGQFLENPAFSPDIGAPRAGKMLGPYRLVREVGRGGMGAVFEAVRDDDDFQQTVAVKVLRAPLPGSDFHRQFRMERRALGQLEHPNVARLIDWGVSDGLCYLAMEYVRDALPIDRHCAGHHLTVPQVLALFLQVCDAVAHAHRNLVVHRDLKPANILVTKDGNAKLLDFGIAKLLDTDDNITATLGLRLTPAYASPEQVGREPIATTSDVYSLGVILYELLTGVLPYDLRGAGIAEAARIIAEQPPARPSGRPGLAGERRRELKHGLDNIVLMALRKEPARRYQSVEQLATDIRRYRAAESIAASPESPMFRVRRLVRRNRLSAALALIATCALIAGTTVSVWKWNLAERNRQIAENRYRSLRDFAHDVIAANRAEYSMGSTADENRMAAAAVRYMNELSREQSNDRELELDIASALQRVGDAQGRLGSRNLGNVAGAVKNYYAAHAILAAQWKADPDKRAGGLLLHSFFLLGNVLPDPAAALAFLSEGVDLGSRMLAQYPDDPVFLERAGDLAQVRGYRLRFSGDLAASLESYRRAISLAVRLSRTGKDNYSGEALQEVNLSEAAIVLRSEGDLTGSLSYVLHGYDITQRLLALSRTPFRRRRAAFRAQVLGSALRQVKRFPEADAYLRQSIHELEALAVEDRSNEQAKWDLAQSLYNLGDLQFDTGRLSDAIETHLESLRLRQGVATRDANNLMAQRTYAQSLNRAANILLVMQRDISTASADFDEAARVGERSLAQAPSDVYIAAQLAASYRGRAEVAWRSPGPANRERVAALLHKSADLWRDARKRCPLDVDLAAEAQEVETVLGKFH
jgi:non-specific serine/threonine protein kinase/serine/threonine-protein kinase